MRSVVEMGNIEPDVREQSLKKNDGNVATGILNKIAAIILGLGAIVAALTYLVGNFTGFIDTAKKGLSITYWWPYGISPKSIYIKK